MVNDVNLLGFCVGGLFLAGAGWLIISGARMQRESLINSSGRAGKVDHDPACAYSNFDRARIVGGISSLFIGIGAILSYVDNLMNWNVPAVLKWMTLGSILGIVVFGVLLACVLQFDRPSFFIPPRMRLASSKKTGKFSR